MKRKNSFECPRCRENRFTPYGVKRGKKDPLPPALSRKDNKTYICSECGVEEALEGFKKG